MLIATPGADPALLVANHAANRACRGLGGRQRWKHYQKRQSKPARASVQVHEGLLPSLKGSGPNHRPRDECVMLAPDFCAVKLFSWRTVTFWDEW